MGVEGKASAKVLGSSEEAKAKLGRGPHFSQQLAPHLAAASPALICTTTSCSKLTCIYLPLILHNDEVTIISLANVNKGSLICNVGAGGPAPAAGAAPAGGPALATAASAEEKKVEAKKEECKRSNNAAMGFGLFD
ncbi:60S acidic ribosomal protein P1-like [Trichechus manatus latirostris]|uniref:60S acidic ribosomal protein P1-like n=1 Tax=Trichechus manatus latirostris TaxID=127582 RepID=A0A2Y9FWJ6_TRIMA|nr:60S acidic ribosomal protein P1-like [Trichechus manatus latirostris]